MLVQAQNGHTLTFTSGKLGSGVLADSDDITKFTDLKSAKMTLPITKYDDSNKEKLVLTFDASNTSLEEGFVSREIGIFAKLDSGEEQLYAYSNAGNNYDYIPSKDTPTDENRLVVSIVVSSSASINVQVDGSIVYVHKSDVESLIAEHNESETAHENLLMVTSTADKPAFMSDRGLWVEIKSGIKAVLHRWNKTTKSYDTIHPETETSQITDFDTAVNSKINTHNSSSTAHSTLFNQCEKTSNLANDIVTKLAQTTAISVISALQTNSWFGQLLKLVLNASGMKYLIAQEGYICFGSLFGGLIIQWGHAMNKNGYYRTADLPITFTTVTFEAVATMGALGNDETVYGCVWNYEESTKSTIQFRTTDLSGNPWYIVVGK